MKGKYKDENTFQVAIDKVQSRRKLNFGSCLNQIYISNEIYIITSFDIVDSMQVT